MLKDIDSKLGSIRVMRVIARMNIGGPAIQISGLYRHLDSKIFNHRIYTGECASDEVDYIEVRASDVFVHRVPGLGRRLGPIRDIKALLFLRSEIKTFLPHIIHSHTMKAGLLLRIAHMTVKHDAKVVHTFHGHILKGYYGNFKTSLIVLLERFLGRFTTRIFAVGEIVQTELIEAGIAKPDKFVVMPPGLELGALPDKNVARGKLNLPTDQILCGYIVRVTQVKRPDRFLDVVRNAVVNKLDMTFVVAGDGDQMDQIVSTATTEKLPIIFLGMIAQIELVFAAIDMVVMTSDNEGMPLTLIQAGMAMLPAVSTDVGSSRHIVLDGESGFITKTLEASEIYERLEQLFKSPELRSQMGQAAKMHCEKNFSVLRLAKDHENQYLSLLAKS
jgi:glycosyltransferase involved in cell wall biosynthesis